MSRTATSVSSEVQPRSGSQLWLRSPMPSWQRTTVPAARGATANSPRPAMRDGRGSASGTAAAPATLQVVGDDELAERAAVGLEDAAAVAPSDLLHERDE